MGNADKGFRKLFLGVNLPFPAIDKKKCAPLKNGSGHEIKYTHFSIFQHQQRRLPLFSAVNIKGEKYAAPDREGNEPWKTSDQVDVKYQIDNRFYGNDENTFDRGHLVRRVDPCWGSQEISNKAEQDTFHWVNCTPQHKKLNQQGGVWYQLEQHIMEKGVKNKIADISVFAGPVLNPKDKVFKKQYLGTEVPIPIVFWKVIVWKKSNGKLYAVGFMMSQWEWVKSKLKDSAAAVLEVAKAAKPTLEDDYFEKLKFSDHKTYQVPVSAIEKATGIKFDWPGVNFPYKAKAYKKVTAVPQKKVYAYKTIFNTRLWMTSIKAIVPEKQVKRELQKEKPLSKEKVKEYIRNGESYLVKQYELKNITL